MDKHTPGPWACHHTSHHAHDYRLTRPNGPMPLESNDVGRANAKLISAAPDMYDALEQALEAWADQFDGPTDQDLSVSGADLVDWFSQWRLTARAALNKAKTGA